MNLYWPIADVEAVAQHPLFIDTQQGFRAYFDKLLTTDTFDSTAMDTAGYVNYVSAYESGTSNWEAFINDDEDTSFEDTRGRTELRELEWLNFQMEFYGIINAMLPEMSDNYIDWRVALPVSSFNIAGEGTLQSDGLGAALHALFKIMIYYPFDRYFDVTYSQMQNEH